MICQKCKVREATVTITKFINNMQITMHLCPECSKNFSPGLQKQISGVNNILMRMMGASDLIENDTDADTRICPVCGMTFAEFRKKGTIGCEKCYEVYRDRFESILKRLHGNYKHVGLSYEGITHETMQAEHLDMTVQKKEENKEESIAVKISNLKKALDEAVAKEEYEEAAKIRDMIKIMEDKPVGGSET